jgi:NAD-dependent SIR2 family protein deacetylase
LQRVGIAEYLQAKDVSRVVCLCGAGISVSAGIPDFRTPGTGLYDNLKQYKLPYPEAVFELQYFRKNPEPFYRLAKVHPTKLRLAGGTDCIVQLCTVCMLHCSEACPEWSHCICGLKIRALPAHAVTVGSVLQELMPGEYKPTPAHHFIKLLHDKGLLLRCYTQNIDSLETTAGVPADKVVAAHGNFDSAGCIDCSASVPVEEVRASILDGQV